ncbi:stage IV sporulation protein FB [Lentibacillus halodurans]|uniref:Stage IV sporulation protein FB n=1 Tax=Lentibacillus halodurans TaxID=237679 RepID=A0A1I0V0C5_9BACI|nr:site-2 protease family protein [Lentibacillus halodurans]SFA68986.1 stage IV sporulation protein FB [Lentibacillus halodurans]
MTRHKWLPPVHIHPILFIFIIISFLTGTFIELMTILVIVFIHELGHFTAAKWFGWRIRGVMLWVFGGVMETDEHGTRPFYEEVLVTLAGPFQHVFIYMILLLLSESQTVMPSIIDMAYFYNTVILLFNLLPIWPLDGGKLTFLIFSEVFPYRKAYYYVIIFSLCMNMVSMLVLLFLVPFTLSAFLLFSFLLMENRKDWKQRYYVFIRFLLRRYQGKAHFKRVLPIEVSHHHTLMDVFNGFYRDKTHTIYVKLPGDIRQSINEMECLHNYFHERNHHVSMGELVSYVS